MAYRLQWECRFDHPTQTLELNRQGSAALVMFGGRRAVLLGNDGQKRWSHTFERDVAFGRLGDTGRYAVFYCHDEMFVYRADKDRLAKIKVPFSADALAIRPRTSLLFLGNRYGLYRHLLMSGKIIARGDLGHGIEFLRFSPDASHCVAADAGGRFTLTKSSAEVCWTVKLNDTLRAIDVAEDARRAVAIGSKAIYLVDQEGTTVDEFSMEVQPVGVSIHPEGNELTFVTQQGLLHRVNADGSHIDGADFSGATSISTDATGMHVSVSKPEGDGSLIQFFAEESAVRPTRVARPARTDRDTIAERGDPADYIEVD